MFSIPGTKKVREVMNKSFITLAEENTLGDVIDSIIDSNEREAMIVNESGEIKGIISLTDIYNSSKNDSDYRKIKISEVMSKNLICIEDDARLDECRNLMINNNIGVLPITKENKVIGVINQTHIRDYLYMELEDYGITVSHIIGEIKEGICAINSQGIVVLWNKFMEERYGIKSDEIIGSHIEKYLKETISSKVLHSRTRENGIYKCEKQEVYGLVDANPIYIDSKFVGVVCTELDITEAKKLSNKLEKVEDRLKYLQDEVKNLSNKSFDSILGKSYKLERAKDLAKRVAKSTSSIFIYGESGTGKELFESEFFGYESGSFTGANKKGKMGIFELAKEGTVFLDEIADLPMSMQAKLLRVLQERELRRIGGEKTIKIDTRIISATNKDLLQLIKEDKFREDLYYRLNVVEIDLPPLRERKEDIVVLIHKFIKEIGEQNNKEDLDISKEALNILQRYEWKGNIRELKNTIENLVVLSRGNIIEKEDIPTYILESNIENNLDEDYPLDLNKAITQLEVNTIKKALDISNGNKSKAAKILNIPRTTLYYKLEQYQIDVSKK